MSSSGGEHADRVAFHDLEVTVGQALDRLAALRERVEGAEARAAEFEAIVARFTNDAAGGSRLLSRLAALEEENADLRDRLNRGREGVERLLARIRFLENQR